jgi:DNA-binding response OmpR family regulator
MAAPRHRILVVEDAGDVRDVFRDALGHAGFEVDTAATATEAVDCLATRRYAVIVADCGLPDLPTLDWLASLRGAAPTTPLVLCSGMLVGDELRRQTADFRAVAVLEKPFSLGQLVAAVRRAIDGP